MWKKCANGMVRAFQNFIRFVFSFFSLFPCFLRIYISNLVLYKRLYLLSYFSSSFLLFCSFFLSILVYSLHPISSFRYFRLSQFILSSLAHTLFLVLINLFSLHFLRTFVIFLSFLIFLFFLSASMIFPSSLLSLGSPCPPTS